jgi:hypothetical protein
MQLGHSLGEADDVFGKTDESRSPTTIKTPATAKRLAICFNHLR